MRSTSSSHVMRFLLLAITVSLAAVLTLTPSRRAVAQGDEGGCSNTECGAQMQCDFRFNRACGFSTVGQCGDWGC